MHHRRQREDPDRSRGSGDDILERAHSVLGGSVTQAALFFVFGAVLLALATKRMDILRAEVAERPMRAFALGVLGLIGFVILCIALCVTVIGIPFAAVAVLLGMFALGAAMCAALTIVGEVALRRRTQNPYVHLAFGCALFLVVCKLPFFISVPIHAALVLIGVGTLVSTRLAGMIPKKRRPAEGPYRTPATAGEDA